MKQPLKICWFCQEKCFEFVSICDYCKQSRKKKLSISTKSISSSLSSSSSSISSTLSIDDKPIKK